MRESCGALPALALGSRGLCVDRSGRGAALNRLERTSAAVIGSMSGEFRHKLAQVRHSSFHSRHTASSGLRQFRPFDPSFFYNRQTKRAQHRHNDLLEDRARNDCAVVCIFKLTLCAFVDDVVSELLNLLALINIYVNFHAMSGVPPNGVVLVGFGDQDAFPGVLELQCYGLVFDRLITAGQGSVTKKVDHRNSVRRCRRGHVTGTASRTGRGIGYARGAQGACHATYPFGWRSCGCCRHYPIGGLGLDQEETPLRFHTQSPIFHRQFEEQTT